MANLIGDTVRLKITVKNLDGEEEAPAAIVVSVYREDGSTALLEDGDPTLTDGTTAQYYYDWEISDTLTDQETLCILWEWTGPHKARQYLPVELAT